MDSTLLDERGHAHVPVVARDWMKKYGGSFAARLAGLYEVADQTNRDKLLHAFFEEFMRAAEQGAAQAAEDLKFK